MTIQFQQPGRFLRWRAASILLIILAVLYLTVALLNLWMGRVYSLRAEDQIARFMYWAAFWNVVVAVLCVVGRQMIKRRTRLWLLAGALAVMVALVVVIRTWVAGLLSGRNPFPVIEALLVWTPLLYVIIYAFTERRKTSLIDVG